MKKSILLTAFAAVLMAVSSCNKEDQTLDTPQTPGYGNKSSDMSPGQIHNLVVNDFIDRNGTGRQSSLSSDDVRSILVEVAEISKKYGIVPFDAHSDDAADMTLNNMKSLGMFENGTLVSTQRQCEMAIASIKNSDIRSAFSQIHELAKANDGNFLEKAGSILANIQNVSSDEGKLLEGSYSVLENSYTLWNEQAELLDLTNPAALAFADFSFYYSEIVLWVNDDVAIIGRIGTSIGFSLFALMPAQVY